jgi:hypothetical protein
MKLKLKPPGTNRLKLKCDGLLSSFGFKFNLRHCGQGSAQGSMVGRVGLATAAGDPSPFSFSFAHTDGGGGGGGGGGVEGGGAISGGGSGAGGGSSGDEGGDSEVGPAGIRRK